jgi:hypothetical protein
VYARRIGDLFAELQQTQAGSINHSASPSLLTSFNPPLRRSLKRHEQSVAGLLVISSLVVGMDLSEGGREEQGPGPDSGAGVGSVAGGVGQKVRSP